LISKKTSDSDYHTESINEVNKQTNNLTQKQQTQQNKHKLNKQYNIKQTQKQQTQQKHKLNK